MTDADVMAERKNYITVYQSITGWGAIELWWNTVDFDFEFGFWEPRTTGDGKYESSILAIEEAKAWADAEEKEFRMPKRLETAPGR